MSLQVVGKAEPFVRQQKHPVNGGLKLVAALRALCDLLHPVLAVAEVKRLLFVDFDQRSLPGTERRGAEYIAQKAEAGAVVEGVGHHKFDPAVERNVEGIGV